MKSFLTILIFLGYIAVAAVGVVTIAYISGTAMGALGVKGLDAVIDFIGIAVVIALWVTVCGRVMHWLMERVR